MSTSIHSTRRTSRIRFTFLGAVNFYFFLSRFLSYQSLGKHSHACCRQPHCNSSGSCWNGDDIPNIPPQFALFSLIWSPSFWHKLTDLKIDVLKLSDESLPITGTYTAGKSITDRETGKEVVLSTNFSVGGESFDASRSGESASGSSNTVTATGSFKNFNTIEEFKSVDKTKFFNDEAQKVSVF